MKRAIRFSSLAFLVAVLLSTMRGVVEIFLFGGYDEKLGSKMANLSLVVTLATTIAVVQALILLVFCLTPLGKLVRLSGRAVALGVATFAVLTAWSLPPSLRRSVVAAFLIPAASIAVAAAVGQGSRGIKS